MSMVHLSYIHNLSHEVFFVVVVIVVFFFLPFSHVEKNLNLHFPDFLLAILTI